MEEQETNQEEYLDLAKKESKGFEMPTMDIGTIDIESPTEETSNQSKDIEKQSNDFSMPQISMEYIFDSSLLPVF